MMERRLVVRQVSKTFGATTVLSDARLEISAGEIHALIGQNGCGKSTLVKVLTGYHSPDPGADVSIDGASVEPPFTWETMSRRGISVVHQDLGLREDASVAENVAFGSFNTKRPFWRVDWKAQERRASEILGRLGFDIDPVALVSTLNATERAVVAIARALRDLEGGKGLVILDEATRALPREGLTTFHGLLKRVVASGTSVLMVTHNLDEVMALADKVTVLRDGNVVVDAGNVAEVSVPELARLMLGKSVSAVKARHVQAPEGRTPLTVESLVVAEGREAVDLMINPGEVVGITGMPGGSHEIFPYILGGGRQAISGTAYVGAKSLDLAKTKPLEARRIGVALVPGRRGVEGLATDLTITDNIALPNLRTRGKLFASGSKWQKELGERAIKDFGIKAESLESRINELSGGNQQKVLFAKWLSVGPDFLVLHEPTQAVDVGARVDILNAVQDAATSGVGVLLATAEVTDLLDVCDRIFVFDSMGRLHQISPVKPEDVVDAIFELNQSNVGV